MEEQEQPRMRRSPRQERGRQRVAQILDAAEAVFELQGYEAATTNQIAAHAAVPIGSLYQFFPNKEALLHAVAERYRAEASAVLAAALTPDSAALPAAALAERLLGAMVAFGTARMGLTRIVLQAGANDRLAPAAAAIMGDASARLAGVLAARHPALAEGERLLGARVALTAVMALLGLVTAEKSRGQEHVDALLAETHSLLAAYLAALDSRASGGPGK
jgi:AcrR family transcriptional regulator